MPTRLIAVSFNLGVYMKIDITMQQSCSDNKISRKVVQPARLALHRFATAIQTVTIRITDTNGPKGGEDTRCIVSVKLASAGEVVVQGEGEKILTVLNQCLSRAARTVSRNLDRRRDIPIRMNRRKTKTEDEPRWSEYERLEYQG
jgi:16S rRNA G1207 methylase RsmC